MKSTAEIIFKNVKIKREEEREKNKALINLSFS